MLTILTFIGCGIGALITIGTPWLMSFSKKMMAKAAESPDMSPDKMAEMRKGLQGIELTERNLVPLIVIGSIGIILCFIGALMMRKLKKDGFWLYMAGQLIPLVGGFIIMGMAQFQGVSSFVIPAISILFIVLYSMQRKYLVF